MQHLKKISEKTNEVVVSCLQKYEIPDEIPKKLQKEAFDLTSKIGVVASPLLLPYLQSDVDVPMDVVMATVCLFSVGMIWISSKA